MPDSDSELITKLNAVRAALEANRLGAVRFRGVDWFAWATCGGSSVVLLAAEVGIAEVLVTPQDAWVLTDVIEQSRLEKEELPDGLEVWACPWQTPEAREAFVAERKGRGPVASDRPTREEVALPAELWQFRSSLLPQERERYRQLGRDAAEAMTEVMLRAKPEWTEYQLAGAGAEALWSRGIQPALTLAAGERRLPLYRHPTPSRERLEGRAMLVFCARRHGLFANLTRFVYFRPPTEAEQRLTLAVAGVEAAAFEASRPGAALSQVYAEIAEGYRRAGYPGAEASHHQGGSCGYLSRDVVARPNTATLLREGSALAWNPSLPGAKIEDTAILTENGLELLTEDPRWPALSVQGRRRPDLLIR